MVSRYRQEGRARRLFAGQRLHGHPAVRIRDLGAAPAGARFADQGNGPRQRVLPAVHPEKPADQGSGARRGLGAAGRVRDARRRRGARRESGRPADLRSDRRDDVRQLGAVVARPAHPDQSVGERRPLGEEDVPVPEDDGVPLAGRAHGARDRAGGRGRDAEDSESLRRRLRERPRDARREGKQDREREILPARCGRIRSKR